VTETPDQRALTASTLALVVAVGCVALFLPPLLDRTVATTLRATAAGLSLTCAVLLHWIFLGMAAKRMQRSAAGWVALAVLLFPVGSAAALILLSWLSKETPGQAVQA
jgi:quinol-cytochrome oxidoreductase complex cytochrome b subunit